MGPPGRRLIRAAHGQQHTALENLTAGLITMQLRRNVMTPGYHFDPQLFNPNQAVQMYLSAKWKAQEPGAARTSARKPARSPPIGGHGRGDSALQRALSALSNPTDKPGR
jgi:hypothetical protein